MRHGLPARQVMPPAKEGEDSLATALWHSTKWCHVLVGFGTGATVLHAQAAYGVSGQPALNRAFWQQALDYAARHGAAPQLNVGDFNFPLDGLLQAPPTLQGLLLTWRLVDADSEMAAAAGRAPLCSYVGVRGGRATRIDGLLVDTRLAALLRGSEVLPACGIPHHRPVRFEPARRGGGAECRQARAPVPGGHSALARGGASPSGTEPAGAPGTPVARGVGSRGRGPPVVNVDLGGGGDAAGALSPRARAGRGAARGSSTLQEGQGHGAATEAGAAVPPPAPHNGRPGGLPRGTLAGSAAVTADSTGLAGAPRPAAGGGAAASHGGLVCAAAAAATRARARGRVCEPARAGPARPAASGGRAAWVAHSPVGPHPHRAAAGGQRPPAGVEGLAR